MIDNFRLRRQRGGIFKPVTVHHVKNKGDICLSPLADKKSKVQSIDNESTDKENSIQNDQVYENTTFIG